MTQTDRGEGNICPAALPASLDDRAFPRRPSSPWHRAKRTEEGRDASEWSGRLPATGAYLLVLGTSRGGGEYSVHMEVH